MTARVILALGLAFLYLPIATVVLFSFNESRLVTVWAGFSTRWYGELMQNRQMLEAAALSLRIAVVSATIATVLGTMAAVAIIRVRFPGRALFRAVLTAPLVLPEVVTGLSLLLLFVSLEGLIGWPQGRGASTVIAAHATLGMAFAAIVVGSRLARLDPSLEEAAMDLGARPLGAFMRVTLPIIAPAVAAAWLLAFTLSLDDLVIASFVSGPGASTLPMVVYSSVRMGVSPQINALATLLVAAVTIGILVVGWLLRRAERR